MATQPARRWSPEPTSAPPRRARRTRADQAERRRRERHRRRLRRDLLEDFGLALLLGLTALIVTAGLGVIALLEVPLLGVVVVSFGLERRLRVRRHQLGDPVSGGPSGSRRRGGSSRR